MPLVVDAFDSFAAWWAALRSRHVERQVEPWEVWQAEHWAEPLERRSGRVGVRPVPQLLAAAKRPQV
jgi:hypothetical protein